VHCGWQVVGLVEARAADLGYVLVDTPGQIEIFTWSASGVIDVEAFASCCRYLRCRYTALRESRDVHE